MAEETVIEKPGTPVTLDAVADTLLTEKPAPTTERPTPAGPTPEGDDDRPRREAPQAEAPDTEDVSRETSSVDDTADLYLSMYDPEPTEYEGGEEVEGDQPTEAPQTFQVKVDGKVRDVTLDELTKAYSAEGAVQSRINEAALKRKEAEQYASQVQEVSARLQHAFDHYNQVLFSPRVQPPDPAMEQTDPIGYLTQMEHYRADQDRIRQEQSEVESLLAYAQQVDAEQKRSLVESEHAKLVEAVPRLTDAKFQRSFKRAVARGAMSAGFTPEEISGATDHRLFLMAAKAAAFDDFQKQSKKGAAEPGVKMPPRAKNPSRVRGGRRSAAKQAQVAKARETGSVDDVAATLLL